MFLFTAVQCCTAIDTGARGEREERREETAPHLGVVGVAEAVCQHNKVKNGQPDSRPRQRARQPQQPLADAAARRGLKQDCDNNHLCAWVGGWVSRRAGALASPLRRQGAAPRNASSLLASPPRLAFPAGRWTR